MDYKIEITGQDSSKWINDLLLNLSNGKISTDEFVTVIKDVNLTIINLAISKLLKTQLISTRRVIFDKQNLTPVTLSMPSLILSKRKLSGWVNS